MKKKYALLMSLMLLTSMFATACGDSDESSKSAKASTTSASEKEDASDIDDTSDEETTTKKQSTTKNGIKLPDASDEAVEDETVDSAAEGTDFQSGTIENNVYTSDFAGISFKIPEGWGVASKEQLLALVNYGLDATGNQDLVDKDSLENNAIYDAAVHGSNGETIMIVFENLKKTTYDPDSVTEKVYLEAMKTQFDNMVSGVTYSNVSGPEKIMLGGKTFYKYSHDATYDVLGGYTVNQCYYCRKIGDLLLSVIMSSGTDGADMSVYESNFSPAE